MGDRGRWQWQRIRRQLQEALVEYSLRRPAGELPTGQADRRCDITRGGIREQRRIAADLAIHRSRRQRLDRGRRWRSGIHRDGGSGSDSAHRPAAAARPTPACLHGEAVSQPHSSQVALFLLAADAFAQSWIMHQSGTEASLRGLGALNEKVVWASGSGGTFVHTSDGGATWLSARVPGAEQLDFRDLHIVDAKTVLLLSIGSGGQSRVYRTEDGGATWKLLFTNPDANGFFDALAFWDRRNGMIVGDAVDGRPTVYTTSDGGENWRKKQTPLAVPNEGLFAASGTCLVVRGKSEAWFGTGGVDAARVFHTKDRGNKWTVATTPIRNDAASAGIFSLAFADARHGIAVGGDYAKPEDSAKSIAVTSDGGLTWTSPRGTPGGFRSAVVYIADRKMRIATGT